MKTFKFRGKSKITGEIIYGDFVYENSVAQFVGYVYENPVAQFVGYVYENSVAQFVGYDKNGEEIYSDDKIRVKDWSRYCMAGTGIEIAGDYFNFNDIGQKFDNVELVKENSEF